MSEQDNLVTQKQATQIRYLRSLDWKLHFIAEQPILSELERIRMLDA